METHEKFNRVEWGEGVEYISSMRGQDDKRGGGISLIKGKNGCAWEKADYSCSDILMGRLNLWKLSIYILLVYIDVKDRERNANIYENLNIGMEVAVSSEMPIIIMCDFNGHVGFLRNQERSYNGTKMLEFTERWNLIMMNCDVKCKGTFARIEGNNKSVIDYVLINDEIYQYCELIRVRYCMIYHTMYIYVCRCEYIEQDNSVGGKKLIK